jgi:acetylornithine deacetylase/succinyl-diaminopimelate desuccinylase-like protein
MERIWVAPTPGHPVVIAHRRGAPGRARLLIYGHYDVQPVDPVRAWCLPPFRPTIRDGYLYGRGSSDDKGQLFAHVKALEAEIRAGGPPLDVVCVFEGEEEVGSPHLGAFLRAHRRELASDVAVVSDTRMLGPDRPTLTYSLRGGAGFEIRVRGPAHDVHSGSFGGAAPNPIHAVCDLIAGLHDQHGRVVAPGFYRRVRTWGPAERAFMARTGPSDRQILRDASARPGAGEPRFSLYERTTIRPALTVNGIGGGYSGPGAKGVIPAEAWAKVSLRLVADQDPEEAMRAVFARLREIAPPGVVLEVRRGISVRPALIDRRHPAMRAAVRAYVRGFGVSPVFVRSGGSIPAVSLFREHLGISTMLMGFASPGDRMHAPNERFLISNFFRGIATSRAFMAELARCKAGSGGAVQ